MNSIDLTKWNNLTHQLAVAESRLVAAEKAFDSGPMTVEKAEALRACRMEAAKKKADLHAAEQEVLNSVKNNAALLKLLRDIDGGYRPMAKA